MEEKDIEVQDVFNDKEDMTEGVEIENAVEN